MRTKGDVLAADVAGIETETALSEISIPDETVNENECMDINNSKERSCENRNGEGSDPNDANGTVISARIAPSEGLDVNNKTENDYQSVIPHTIPNENLALNNDDFDKTIEENLKQADLNIKTNSGKNIVGQLYDVKSGNATWQEDNDVKNCNKSSNITIKHHSVVANENGNSQVHVEDCPTDLNRSNGIASLTRENLKQHTRILKKDHRSKHFQTQPDDGNIEPTDTSEKNETEEQAINNVYITANSEIRGNEQNCQVTTTKTLSEKVNAIIIDNFENTESKSTIESITKFSEKITRSSSKMSLKDSENDTKQNDMRQKNNVSPPVSNHRRSHASFKESTQTNVNRKVKKKQQTGLENVETLVSRDQRSNSKNRKRRMKKTKSKEHKDSQDPKLINEDSGIEKDIEEYNDLLEKENESNSAEHQDGCVDEGPVYVHKRLLKRGRQRRYSKRPMYDTMNTSTKMILLNNKYGKHSRLWRSEENNSYRRKLINPLRHLKERSFYLSGNFHSRCSTSESVQRYCFPANNEKFDFSDRPQSDKIGDRLYEAKMSVNPNRHRSCVCKLPTLPKPLDFSAPTKEERSNTYVFAWERLYAEPATRPATSLRPISSLSGKQIGTRTIKIPRVHLSNKENTEGQETLDKR